MEFIKFNTNMPHYQNLLEQYINILLNLNHTNLRQAGQFIVDQCGNVELQHFCIFSDDVSSSSILFVTTQLIVHFDYVSQFVCQIILQCKITLKFTSDKKYQLWKRTDINIYKLSLQPIRCKIIIS